jgi:hypothetical protein
MDAFIIICLTKRHRDRDAVSSLITTLPSPVNKEKTLTLCDPTNDSPQGWKPVIPHSLLHNRTRPDGISYLGTHELSEFGVRRSHVNTHNSTS